MRWNKIENRLCLLVAGCMWGGVLALGSYLIASFFEWSWEVHYSLITRLWFTLGFVVSVVGVLCDPPDWWE